MTDRVDAATRSKIMSRIRGKNTKPEITIRKLLFGMGYRYRLHDNKLPGTPDIVFRGKKKVIFINGCFWHGHQDPQCKHAQLPKTRPEFWLNKISKNSERDIANKKKLSLLGWEYLTVWECEIKNFETLTEKLKLFLY